MIEREPMLTDLAEAVRLGRLSLQELPSSQLHESQGMPMPSVLRTLPIGGANLKSTAS